MQTGLSICQMHAERSPAGIGTITNVDHTAPWVTELRSSLQERSPSRCQPSMQQIAHGLKATLTAHSRAALTPFAICARQLTTARRRAPNRNYNGKLSRSLVLKMGK